MTSSARWNAICKGSGRGCDHCIVGIARPLERAEAHLKKHGPAGFHQQQHTTMSDTKGNTPQDRRTVALSEDHERRHFIDQYVRDHPGTSHSAVIDALDEIAASIAPSESREKMTRELERRFGSRTD